jgi:CelD/BcsL family acetyltransferase involved in cellulose biosynthesis
MPMDPNTEEFSRLEDAFRGAGITVRFFCFGNWYLKVDAVNYDEYMRTRPSKLRVNVTRSRRKLQESGRLRLDIIRSHEGLEAAKAAYHSIYNSSWKKAEPFPLFIDGLLGVCADHGWLRLGVAYVDGEPAAAQIWLVIGDTASIFKMAYDERFIKLSIGTVLSSYLMEHVIDIDKVRTVDYLSGDDAYKRDWMSHRRERWGISVFNPLTLDGFAAAARHFGGRGFRRLAAVLPSRRTAGNQPVTALTEKNR